MTAGDREQAGREAGLSVSAFTMLFAAAAHGPSRHLRSLTQPGGKGAAASRRPRGRPPRPSHGAAPPRPAENRAARASPHRQYARRAAAPAPGLPAAGGRGRRHPPVR